MCAPGKGLAKPRIESVRRVRTHRSSEVDRDEEFFLALVSWRIIHSQSLGLTSWGALHTASHASSTCLHPRATRAPVQDAKVDTQRSQEHLFLFLLYP